MYYLNIDTNNRPCKTEVKYYPAGLAVSNEHCMYVHTNFADRPT